MHGLGERVVVEGWGGGSKGNPRGAHATRKTLIRAGWNRNARAGEGAGPPCKSSTSARAAVAAPMHPILYVERERERETFAYILYIRYYHPAAI